MGCQTLWRRLTSSVSTSLFPSTIPESGLLNQARKSSCDVNTFGMRKWRSDHNSIREFCSGVPINIMIVDNDAKAEI